MKMWKKRAAALALAAAAAVLAAMPAAAGWQREASGLWSYQDEAGNRLTGWQQIGGRWYYLNGSGLMQTGWLWRPEGWYYLQADGAMAVGWRFVDGDWYYFSQSGLMRTGWLYDGGQWYYLAGSGRMERGWLELNDGTYYLGANGAMLTGTQEIGGATYTFTASGRLIQTADDTAAALLSAINRYRAEAGLPALTGSVTLNQAAAVRAEEASRSFSHTRPDGRSWYTVLEEAGQGNTAAGENLAANYRTAEEAAAAWMNSDSHRDNILNPNYQYMGGAAFEREDGTVFWAQLFTDRLN